MGRHDDHARRSSGHHDSGEHRAWGGWEDHRNARDERGDPRDPRDFGSDRDDRGGGGERSRAGSNYGDWRGGRGDDDVRGRGERYGPSFGNQADYEAHGGSPRGPEPYRPRTPMMRGLPEADHGSEGYGGSHRSWGGGRAADPTDRGGYKPPQADDHRFDPDYRQWRDEQMRAFDDDYRQWRQDRYKKFSDEFTTWRSGRTAGRGGDDPTKGTPDEGGLSPGTGPTTPGAKDKPPA